MQQPPPLPPLPKRPNAPMASPHLPPKQSQGLAIASVLLGVLSLPFALFACLGMPMALVGIGTGLAHMTRHRTGKGMAATGIALSCLSLFLVVGMGLLFAFSLSTSEFLEDVISEDTEALARWKGVQAPEIDVKTSTGERFRLSDLRGSRVILMFSDGPTLPSQKAAKNLARLLKEDACANVKAVLVVDSSPKLFDIVTKGIPIARAENLAHPYSDVFDETLFPPVTFFIDRQGVIQDILFSSPADAFSFFSSGSHTLDELRRLATADDYEGEVLLEPKKIPESLLEAEQPLAAIRQWTVNVPNAAGLCVGDWDRDGQADVLVVDDNPALHVIGADGQTKTTQSLLNEAKAASQGNIAGRSCRKWDFLRLGVHKDAGPRLLMKKRYEEEVWVVDAQGQEVWQYESSILSKDALWFDLDNDGSDELILTVGDFGTIHAVSEDGKRLWKRRTMAAGDGLAAVRKADGTPIIFCSGATGKALVLDHEGERIDSLGGTGSLTGRIAAMVVDGESKVQLLVADYDGRATAVDGDGTPRWRTPISQDGDASYGNATFASGDINGDGLREWALVETGGDLALATHEGERIATVPNGVGMDHFTILEQADGHGLLITLDGNAITAYSFTAQTRAPEEQAAETPVDSAPTP